MKKNYTLRVAQSFTFLLIYILLLSNLSSIGQALTMISPNGGENWQTETTQTIKWELTGDPQDLMIELSTDGGIYWNYISFIPAEDTLAELTFSPYYSPTENALMRISVYDNPSINDASDNVFTISENPVYYYTIYDGLQVYSNISFELLWYSNFATANIDYSYDNGATWNSIAINFEGQDFFWTTPNIQSDQCIIKITDASDNSVFGLSPTFSITGQPTAAIITPNGGETWNYGETALVSWTGTDLPYYIYIEYSADGGVTWDYFSSSYSDPTGGSVEAYVPYESTDKAKVRLVDPNFELTLDESDQPFTIYVPPVIMYNPYEGQGFYIKDVTYINWMATGIDLVNIELSTDNGNTWFQVDQNIDANVSWYLWNIEGIPSENCLIKVSDASDPSSYGLSGLFSLLATPIITLNNPAGGEIWNTNTSHALSWTYDNENAYYTYIEFSNDNGLTWNYIGYGYMDGNQGTYNWVTPEITSEQCLIRIRDPYLNFVSDTSDLFTIRPFPETPICIVTVDSATNNNIIVWEKPQNNLINTFIVYKETDITEVYEQIGTVNYDNLSLFIDTNSNPLIKSYRYKLGFSDSKGNVYPMGSMHQTIHLSINQGVGNSWNLIWTDYLGFNVSSYNIYRSSNESGYNKIATISSSFNSYTDIEAPAGSVYYYIEVINESGCNLVLRETSYNNSISNIATNSFLSVNEPELISAKVYPNPAKGMAKLIFNNGQKSYTVQLLDLVGNVIFSEKINAGQVSSEIRLDVSQLSNGLYFIKISDGINYSSKKLVVQN